MGDIWNVHDQVYWTPERKAAFRKKFNGKKHEADAELKAIALRAFGTRDGLKPLMPRSGELIQEAMEQAYDLGKSK